MNLSYCYVTKDADITGRSNRFDKKILHTLPYNNLYSSFDLMGKTNFLSVFRQSHDWELYLEYLLIKLHNVMLTTVLALLEGQNILLMKQPLNFNT